MSLKRTFSEYDSQQTTLEDYTQEDMVYGNRNTRSNAMVRRPLRRVVKIPKSIRTRGTPSGYYEIPTHVYRKVYFNMSTGLWPTDQTTGANTGLTGYNGFSLNTSLDSSTMRMGNGAFSAQISQTVPGFAEIQGVFDECQISRIKYDIWLQGAAHEISGAGIYQSPNMFIVVDPNNADPPANIGVVMQYGKLRTVAGDINRPTSFTVYPRIRADGGSSEDEVGSGTTLGVTQAAPYIQTAKPGVIHFCVRGWFDTNPAVTATTGYMHIRETQYRRYKRII